jgi:hypothetical protein
MRASTASAQHLIATPDGRLSKLVRASLSSQQRVSPGARRVSYHRKGESQVLDQSNSGRFMSARSVKALCSTLRQAC